MALTERTENDKIEVVGQYKTVQVRCATIIEKDGVEVARTFQRHLLDPGKLDGSDSARLLYMTNDVHADVTGSMVADGTSYYGAITYRIA